jgi:AcrR family transcriptional regulator
VAARRRTRTEALEPAILAAAEAILESDGPEGLSIRKIAERAQVAPMGLYSRFQGKHGIVDALILEGFDRLTEATVASSTAEADAVAGLRAAGIAYRRLALEHSARYELMFLRVIPGWTPSERVLETALRAFDALGQVVRRCMDDGVIREGDAAEIAQQWWAVCHGWVVLELCGINFAADLDVGYEALLDVYLRGVQT